jgi:hypothetical protein
MRAPNGVSAIHDPTGGETTMSRSNRTGVGVGALALRLALVAALGAAACDFLDPTQVENPRTTSDDLAGAAEPTAALLPGLRAQFARLVSSTVVVAEVVSDNYSIHGTGLQKEWDSPREVTPSVNNSTSTATGIYWNAQELRALASFILDEIAPDDSTATAEQVAEASYYRGMAYLTLGESFSFAPVEEDGAAIPAQELLDRAVTDLGQAAGVGDIGVAANAALARAQRWKGDAAAATAAAQAVLGAEPSFLFMQEYDAASIENQPFAYLVLRALQEMQPLPRLDFLDPKYLTREQGIVVAKAEEMHLILAEIALAQGGVGEAGGHLAAAIDLADSRSSQSFLDEDARLNADLSIRPRDASIMVRADANSPYRAGLVLTRPAQTTQHTTSATSLSADSVAALSSEAEMWHTLFLARQEILFLEGRRMSDLGIRLPMMLREIDANPAIETGGPGTTAVVPDYIPAGDAIDLFSPASPYDEDGNLLTTEVTIQVDLNRVLAENRVTPFGS